MDRNYQALLISYVLLLRVLLMCGINRSNIILMLVFELTTQ